MAEIDACIPNIGPAQRRRRTRFGWTWLALSLVLAAALGLAGASRSYRALVFLPLVLSAIGFFQARAKTCVRLAHQGRRNLDGGSETIDDAAVLTQMRRQARTVYLESLAAATAVSAAFLSLP